MTRGSWGNHAFTSSPNITSLMIFSLSSSVRDGSSFHFRFSSRALHLTPLLISSLKRDEREREREREIDAAL